MMPTNKTIEGYEKKNDVSGGSRKLTQNPAQPAESKGFAANFNLSELSGKKLGGLSGVNRTTQNKKSGDKNAY